MKFGPVCESSQANGLSILAGERSMTLLPKRSIKEMEGFLRGVDGGFERQPDREI